LYGRGARRHDYRLRLAFFGQCHTLGYQHVPTEDTFPEVARRAIEAARPGVTVRI